LLRRVSAGEAPILDEFRDGFGVFSKLRMQPLAAQGSRGFWLHILKDITTGSGGEEDPFDDAQVYGRLADADNAMEALRRDFDGRSFFMTFINVDPAYDAIRSDTRFSSLVKRMGL
jgi:hypothetical protein